MAFRSVAGFRGILQFIINQVTVGTKAAKNGGNVQVFYLTFRTVEEKIEGNKIALSYSPVYFTNFAN